MRPGVAKIAKPRHNNGDGVHDFEKVRPEIHFARGDCGGCAFCVRPGNRLGDGYASPAAEKSRCRAARRDQTVAGNVAEAKPDAPPADAKALPGEANEPLTGEADNAEGSGLPIPRFVSLRTDPVNMRSGPGLRYPVEWVYRRRHLPVEVIAEFDTWRQIRDPDGTTGWVHQSMITGRRTGMVHGTAQALRRSDGDDGNAVATLEAGVIVNVQRCPAGSQSCRVEVNGLQGWLKRDQMWGVYPTETVE